MALFSLERCAKSNKHPAPERPKCLWAAMVICEKQAAAKICTRSRCCVRADARIRFAACRIGRKEEKPVAPIGLAGSIE